MNNELINEFMDLVGIRINNGVSMDRNYNLILKDAYIFGNTFFSILLIINLIVYIVKFKKIKNKLLIPCLLFFSQIISMVSRTTMYQILPTYGIWTNDRKEAIIFIIHNLILFIIQISISILLIINIKKNKKKEEP